MWQTIPLRHFGFPLRHYRFFFRAYLEAELILTGHNHRTNVPLMAALVKYVLR